jgi:hypothetical protein
VNPDLWCVDNLTRKPLLSVQRVNRKPYIDHIVLRYARGRATIVLRNPDIGEDLLSIRPRVRRPRLVPYSIYAMARRRRQPATVPRISDLRLPSLIVCRAYGSARLGCAAVVLSCVVQPLSCTVGRTGPQSAQ